MELGVGQLPFPEAVEEDQRIPGAALPGLQQRDAHGHVQFSGQTAEGADKFTFSGDRLGLPLLRGAAVDAVSVAPHLREQGDVRSQLLRLAAGGGPLLQVSLQAVCGRDLEQGDFQQIHKVLLSFECKG